MKKTLFTIIFLAVAIVASAQDNNTKNYTREGDTFVQMNKGVCPSEGDQVTAYYWKDSKGNTYPIILHTYVKGEKAGRVTCYVIRTSQKTGKEYKYYLPNGEQIAEEIIKENE